MKPVPVHIFIFATALLGLLQPALSQHMGDSLHSGAERYQGYGTAIINYGNSGWIQFSPHPVRDYRHIFQFKTGPSARYDTSLVILPDTTTQSTLEYASGSGKNQLFHAEVYRPLAKQVFLGASVTRLSSEGFYPRSFSRHTIGNIGLDYLALEDRLSGNIRLKYAYFDLEQNGGTTESSFYFSNDLPTKQPNTWNIALQTAYNRETTASVEIAHAFRLFGSSDSLSKASEIRLIQESSLKDYKFRFEDLAHDSAYYTPFLAFSPYFKDFNNKAYNLWIDNQLGLEYLKKDSAASYGLSLTAGYEIVDGRVQSTRFDFHNVFSKAAAKMQSGKLNIGLETKYVFEGYNRGDILSNFGAGLVLVPGDSVDVAEKLRLDLNGYFDKRAVPFFELHQLQHVNGTYSDPSQNNFQTAIALSSPKYLASLYAGFGSYTNFYFPFLEDSLLSLNSYNYTSQFAGLKKHFRFWVFHFETDHRLQVLNGAPFDFPSYTTINEFYYQGSWFKDALFIMIGFRGLYRTEYFGQGYLPFADQFHGQGQYLFGNYPFVDFFLNARIKSAWVYFRMNHLNHNLTGTDYFVAPGFYAAMPRRMYLGVKWHFLN